jgi:hypothetical protein
MIRPLPAALLLRLSACASWAETEKYEYKAHAPARIVRGGDFPFRVDAATKEGAPIEGMKFRWSVEWPTLKGEMETGKTIKPYKIRAKGPAGKGSLKVYGYDPAGDLVPVASADFDVE